MTTLIANLREDKDLDKNDKIDILKGWVDKIEISIATNVTESDVFGKWVGYKQEIENEIAVLQCE